MTTEIQELPEPGEILITTVMKIMDHGVYVTLDEYNDIQGFLHISEIAPGWIRSINKYVKQGEKKVLLVKRVNPERGDIDLSLKQVSNDQKKKKLLEFKRFEKSKTFLQNIKEKSGISDSELDALEESLYTKYNSIYHAFVDIARNGTIVIKDLNLSEKILLALKEVCKNINLPSVEIRGILEISSNRTDGVELIKKTLLDVMKKERDNNDFKVEITYLGAPKYRLSVISQDFKSAEKALKPILVQIQQSIEKKKGTYRFEREESKKTREG
jgi:translation initiation factor 2 subunit 1